jgi:hypothetical protein
MIKQGGPEKVLATIHEVLGRAKDLMKSIEPVTMSKPLSGGKERMRRLLSLVQSGRFDANPLITHCFLVG